MNSISFFATGKPIPQGSMKCYCRGGKPVVLHDSDDLKGWRETVGWAAKAAMGSSDPWDDAVSVEVLFRLPKPKSRKDGEEASRKPDVDKLLRGIFDAMEKIVYTQDARVVRVVLEKEYALTESLAGALIYVERRR